MNSAAATNHIGLNQNEHLISNHHVSLSSSSVSEQASTGSVGSSVAISHDTGLQSGLVNTLHRPLATVSSQPIVAAGSSAASLSSSVTHDQSISSHHQSSSSIQNAAAAHSNGNLLVTNPNVPIVPNLYPTSAGFPNPSYGAGAFRPYPSIPINTPIQSIPNNPYSKYPPSALYPPGYATFPPYAPYAPYAQYPYAYPPSMHPVLVTTYPITAHQFISTSIAGQRRKPFPSPSKQNRPSAVSGAVASSSVGSAAIASTAATLSKPIVQVHEPIDEIYDENVQVYDNYDSFPNGRVKPVIISAIQPAAASITTGTGAIVGSSESISSQSASSLSSSSISSASSNVAASSNAIEGASTGVDSVPIIANSAGSLSEAIAASASSASSESFESSSSSSSSSSSNSNSAVASVAESAGIGSIGAQPIVYDKFVIQRM